MQTDSAVSWRRFFPSGVTYGYTVDKYYAKDRSKPASSIIEISKEDYFKTESPKNMPSQPVIINISSNRPPQRTPRPFAVAMRSFSPKI